MMDYRRMTDHELSLLLGYAALTTHSDPNLLKEIARRLDPDSDDIYREMIAAGRKIVAIKEYRTNTGATLKDAKEYIDKLEASMGETPL